jgi:PAS domain S-box-containing protein
MNPVIGTPVVSGSNLSTNASVDTIHEEDLFRRLVEEANDLIWSAQLDTVLTYLSPQFREMFGREPEEGVGRSFIEFIYPADLDGVWAFVQKVLDSREKQAGHEFRYQHKEEDFLRWATSNISPIKDEQGQVIGLQGILRDITVANRQNRH